MKLHLPVDIENLSNEPSSSRIGANVGGNLINHVCYADDLALISPCSAGMEKLLAIGNKYGIEHELVYNSLKVILFFK